METTDNPEFKPFTNDFTEEEALNRMARAIAASKNLFQTDISKLDDAQVSGLYQATARALFQIEDPDGKVAFGKKAGDARTNVGLLRDFCKGNYKLIQDDEYESWRAMDEERKFLYALENEGVENTAKSYFQRRGLSISDLAGAGMPGAQFGNVFQNANAPGRNEVLRKQNYESLTPEEQAVYRKDVIDDYEKKLSKRQVLATYLTMTDGLSDRASTLLAKAYNTGAVDVEAMEALPQKERDQAYTALSIMRGDQKKGRILGIQTDFTDDTAANRLQLCLYGFQQGVLGLIPDTYELGKDAAKWAYAKFCLDDAERKRYIDRWDAQVRMEQALKQGLPEAESWWGAGFQGAAESAALLVPYLGIGKGGKLMRAATAVGEDASWLKRTAAMLNPLRAGSQHRARAKLVEGVKAIEEANYAASIERLTTLDKISGGGWVEGNSLLARQLANIDTYTKELRELKKLSGADLRKWGLGAASWSAGEATAFGSFAKEYVETCDAAGISRYDSVPMAAAVGLINAQIEHLYVPGLESTLSASEVKSLMFGSMLQAMKSDGAAGFKKWLANRIEKGVVEGVKVAATEGMVEEPLQQIVIEHGKAIAETAQKLREEGRGDLADQLSAYWEATKDTLSTDFQTFIDTAVDTMPSSVVFGLTTVGNQTRRQRLNDIWTRHANRAKYAREVELAKSEGREIPAPPVMFSKAENGFLQFNPNGVDYDAGIADMIGKAAATQKAVTDYWAENGQEQEGEDVRLANALAAARKAWDAGEGDVYRQIADAAKVDMRTAEVIAEYFIAEDETKLYSPQLRTFADYSLSAADMSEKTLERILTGYVKGSYKADEKNGVYSGQVKLEDGSVKTIAYKVGDISEELLNAAAEQIGDDSELGVSHDIRIKNGTEHVEKLWAQMSDQERYAYALHGVQALAGGAGIFEVTEADGAVSRISADAVIYLSNGRLGDIGYGPMANLGTARHETWHAIWRFAKSSFTEAERQNLAKKLGIDVTAKNWETELDEAMAYQFELYASGAHVPHVTTGAIDRLLQSTAAKWIGELSKFGIADEMKNAKTGKPFALADFYDAVMRGEIGTGRLGIAQVATEAPQPEAAAPQKKTKKELPVEVSEAELAEAETAAANAAAEETEDLSGSPAAKPEEINPQPKADYTLDSPADASVPDARFYRISAGDGVDLVGELVVSDARDLKTSYKGNLSDPSLQNRAETNEGRSLVEKIAGSPDPLQVGTVQPRANNGFVWTTPSLDTFIGNTRESGISAAYEKGNAAAVRAYMLAEAAKRGIEVPEGIEQPIVHFVLRRIESKDGKASIQDVVRMTNQSVNRGMNVYEQAKNDADVLVGAGLVPHIALRPDGRIDTAKSAEAIGRFIQETGAQGMVDENTDALTEDGQTRLQNAVLAALLGNENADTVAKMMREADRLDIENEKRALMKTAAELMRLATAKPQYDLRQPLAEALDYYLNWRDVDERKREEAGKNRRDWYERTKDGERKRGLTWAMHMGQGDMFRTPSPEARLLCDLLAASRDLRSFDAEDRETDAGKKRAQDLITGFLGDYIRNADAVNTETVDLLGTPPPSRIELLETHRGTDASRRFSTVSTDTPEFKAWFGDSKVVDADGRPLKVYRGSPYDPLKQPAGKGVIMPEAYFTADPEYARRYGKVNAYYLRMRKPFDIRNDADAARLREFYPQGYQFAVGRNGALDWGEMANFDLDELREKYPEYDGIVLDEGGDPQIDGSVKDRGVSYVPFDGGAQVKSATDNIGTFDPANPDIRYSTIAAAISDESKRRRAAAERAAARFSTSGLYTGSAADYAKPSLLKVGTGEGERYYGWGLYASPYIGEAGVYGGMAYRRALEHYQPKYVIKIDGIEIDEKEFRNEPHKFRTIVSLSMGESIDKIRQSTEMAIAFHSKMLERDLNAGREGDVEIDRRQLDSYNLELSFIDEIKDKLVVSKDESGKPVEAMYEQTFFTNRAPGDTSHLVYWSKPVSEENWDRVEAQYKSETGKSFADAIRERGLSKGDISRGELLYNVLDRILGGDKEASLFLIRSDIDGMKVPDGYVSFRDDNIRVDHKWVDGVQRFSTVKVGKVNVPIVTDYEAAKAIDPKQPKTIEKYILEHLKNDVVMAEGGVADINDKTARHYGWSKVRGKRDRNLRRARAKAAAILEDILKQVRATKQTEQPDKHGRGDKVWRCRLPFAIPTFDPKTRIANGVNVFDGDVIVKDEGNGKFLYDISELEKNEALTRQLTQQMLRGRNNGASNMTQSAMSASVTGSITQPAEKGNAPRRVFSSVGSAYPNLNRLSDEQLIAVALASKTVFGKAGKKQSQHFTINEVQRHIKALHPDWDGPKVSLESTRIYQLVRPIKAKLQEDIQRGVSQSNILQHLPERLKEEFGSEMTQQARTGARIGTTHQRAESLLEERKVKVVEDAVRVQSGIESQILENQYGVDLSRTLMNLADNPYLKKDGQGNFLPPPGAGSAPDGQPSGISENPSPEKDVDEKVKKAVSEIVGKTKEELDQSEANRRSLSDQRGRDAEREAEMAGENGEEGGLDPSDGDIVEIATRKAGVDLQNPRHLALFVAELARRHWVKEHGLAENAEAFKDAVALQFLRKTAQDVYRKLVRDITYSQSRDSATAAINGFENVPTLRGLISEMTFAGQLINARKIRETAQDMCEKLDTSLQENFGASGRFKPDNEELRRKVSTEMELRARYTRHAIWLTPNAAGKEADLLQKEIDAVATDFDREDHDAEQSRVMVENIRKINILREFGGLRYKPLAQIQSALEYWDNAQQGEGEQIARDNLEREIRTKKAAEVLAKAFRNPKTKYAKDGNKLLSVIDDYIEGHMGFTHLLRDMMRYASKEDAAAAEEILRYLELEIQKAGTRVMTQKRRHADALAKAVQQIYGRNFGKVLAEFCKKDERFAEFMGETDGKKDDPTKGRAMQLMVSLLQVGRQVEVIDPEDPKKTKLEWQGGYHDNIEKHHREGQAAKIAALLTPQDLQLVKWLGNWYDNNRQELSSVCQDLFGIGVYAETSNYMPVKMRLDAQGLEKGEAVGWTIFPKALMPRVRNERDFDTRADILQMFMARMEEGEQWKAHAKLGLEMRGIFGRSDLQAAVIASHGTKANAVMLGFVTDILAGHGATERAAAGTRVEGITNWVRGWTALGALGGNVGVTFKQTTSIPAFGFEVGLVKTGRYMISAFSPDGMAAMKKIWDSDERKNRWNVGNSEAVANALAGNDVSALKRFMRASMITNKVGDCVPGLVCGQGIYRDCIEQGMDEEDAMAKTWMLIERTQQSGRIENQAGFQRRTKFGRMLYQFLTTQQQYLSYEARAIRAVAAKPGDLGRWGKLGETLILNHFLLSSAYYWMGELYKMLLGKEPDDEEELADWIVTCLLGPYGALYGLGITATESINMLVKGRKFGKQGQLPSLSWASNFAENLYMLISASIDGEKTFDDVIDAAAKWASDSNAIFRDLRKVYRWRIKEEPQ